MSRLKDRRWASGLALATLALLVVAFANRLALSNLILARGDVYLYFYPYWEMAATALRDGRIPFWNPAIFMGAPFLANSQTGFFYPFNWPLWATFSTPYAVSASVVGHLFIAGAGTYLLGRRGLNLSPLASLLAAVLFALGGYLTAQIEHVNQLQGLAWLPWLFVALASLSVASPAPRSRRVVARALLGAAVCFALQLLAGHTQTAFISGVAVVIWSLVQMVQQRRDRSAVLALAAVAVGAVGLSLLLAAVQLGPTLELTALSARQGGLTLAEVLSFSWHPLHISRSLLPTYGQSLFTEYVAVLPITALVLAVVGAWSWRSNRVWVAWIVLAIVGLALALGQFTPLYWVLARVPGFDLFRVPARWLVLYALSVALLAGAGWDVLRLRLAAGSWRVVARPLAAAALLVVALMAWGFAAGWLDGVVPTGQEAPYEAPNVRSVIGWLIEILLLAGLLWVAARGSQAVRRWALFGLIAVAVGGLWLATRTLPYNHPTTPEAYFDVRPPIARLQALGSCAVPDLPCVEPPGRVLSLSEIQFDLGDQAEIDSIYKGQLDEQARREFTVATKQKEVVSPNLPMVFDLASVDGFDGGILPLSAYASLVELILPPGSATTDGRLREYLTAVPEQRWLDLFNARYVITDKVGDMWVDGVFFDRQHPVRLKLGEAQPVGFVPRYEATAVHLLSGGNPPALVGETIAGERWQLAAEPVGDGLHQVTLPQPAAFESLALVCPADSTACEVDSLTLVDARDETFQPLVAGPFRLIHSGDVKVYENFTVQPRAFLVHDWVWQADEAGVLAEMAADNFDARTTAVLLGDGVGFAPPSAGGESEVVVVEYLPERVVLRVSSDSPGLLVMTDALYPGWQATVSGEAAALIPANGLFRGVFVPAGEHELIMTYESAGFSVGALLSAAGWLAVVVGLVWVWAARRHETGTGG